MSPAVARASVATARGADYVTRLARHWSHKLNVVAGDGHARIVFPSGAVAVLDADGEELQVSVEASDASSLEETKSVLIDHLNRFAFREAPFDFRWL